MTPQGKEFSQLDADFVRVLEDLIDALIANGTLRLTDLPVQAQPVSYTHLTLPTKRIV